jgi:hypothetical protein
MRQGFEPFCAQATKCIIPSKTNQSNLFRHPSRSSFVREKVVICAIVFCVITLNAIAQDTSIASSVPSPATRDADAVTLVQTSLAAMGGTTAIGAIKTVAASGSVSTVPSSDTTSTTDTQSTKPFTMSLSINGSFFEFRRESGSPGNTSIFASGHGSPGYQNHGTKARPLSQHVTIAALPYDLPAILLFAELSDPNFSLRFIPTSGTDLAHVEITNESTPFLKKLLRQDWYFDPATGLPTRVDYLVPSTLDAFTTIPATCTYGTFARTEGVLFPSSILASEDGKQIAQVIISTVTTNSSLAESMFDLNIGGTQR